MWVQFLGQEDPLEEGMSTHSSVLAWRIPKDRGAWWAKVHGVTKSWTRLSTAQPHPYNLSLLIASFVEIELQYGLFLSFFICKYYATFFWLSSLILNTHFWDTHALNFDFSSLCWSGFHRSAVGPQLKSSVLVWEAETEVQVSAALLPLPLPGPSATPFWCSSCSVAHAEGQCLGPAGALRTLVSSSVRCYNSGRTFSSFIIWCKSQLVWPLVSSKIEIIKPHDYYCEN